jgi:predicted ATPase/DNA-binding XRE family transcriptional regulator
MAAEHTFGDWLRQRRQELDLTREELARQVGCSSATLRKLEAEERRPSKQMAGRLAEVLHVPPDERATFVRFARGDPFAARDDTKVPEKAEQPQAPRHNLPLQLTSFIGREKEIAEVKRFLASSRLVTLTGPGGMGKTRLALQVAADDLDDFTEGAWFVELAALTDPALIPRSVALVFGLRDEARRPPLAMLADYLHSRNALIILDNCEHLIADCAQVADALLHAAPSVKILTTSREVLNIGGEVTYRVPPLAGPDLDQIPSLETLEQYDAVKLFTERAKAVLPSLEINRTNAPAVALICHHLDGMPLAIELAAARVRGLRVEQIAERLHDRFRLLTGGGRTALPRHQTLWAMIDWSHALLNKQEQILFRRLAAFTGSWSIESAEAVCAIEETQAAEREEIKPNAVLDLLLRLVDKSLVVMDEHSAETRYRMLETIREYALARLREAGEEGEIRARHLGYFRDLAERTEPQLHGSEHITRLNRMAADSDNFYAALDWSLRDGVAESTVEAGLRLAVALTMFWWYRGLYRDGISWLERVLTAGKHTSKRVVVNALISLAGFEIPQGNTSAGRSHAEEGLALARELDDQSGIAFGLTSLGDVALIEARYADATALYEQSRALFRVLEDKTRQFALTVSLGETEQAQGNYLRAGAIYYEALALARELGIETMISVALYNLGYVTENLGDYTRAAAYFRGSLTEAQKVGIRGIEGCLIGLAGVAGRSGQPEHAARLFGAGEALLESIGARLESVYQKEYERDLAVARAQSAADQFERARAEGRSMTMEQAIELALRAE